MSAAAGTAGIRLLADDLTGALDSAAAFAGEIPVTFDRPEPDGAAPVSAVATATRDVPAVRLASDLAPSLAWLAGAAIAFKKVDSLLRGNTFAEVAHLARAGGFERVVFAPAFPLQGRLTVGGRLVLPATPDAPLAGPTMAESLAALGVAAEVPEVRCDDDLLRVARQALSGDGPRTLWCGSAGLAHALAQVLGLAARRPTVMAGAGQRPALLVSASHHPVVRRQWARLAAGSGACAVGVGAGGAAGLNLDTWPQPIVARDGDEAALAAALTAVRSPFALALLDLSPPQPLDADAAAALLAGQLDRIAAALASTARPGVLAVVGGDTLRGLCRSTGARGLLASASARPGWGQARWLGGAWDGLPCHSRSGAFGTDDDLVEVVQHLVA